MQFQISRRTFMSASALALATPLVAGAATPPVRNGKPYMKLSLAAYSFNKQLANRGTPEEIAAAEMNLEKFIDYCASLDLDGCELTSYYFPKTVTHEYLMALKERTFRLGLDISGTAIGNDFCLPEGNGRDEQLAMCREWIDHAATMGAPVIRIFAGKVPRGDEESEAIARCTAGINESLKYAAEKGVCLALENHGGITATPKQMMRIIEGIDDSPWFGVNFDSGNFQTDDPYASLAVIAPYSKNVQIKVKMRPNGGREEADFGRIIGMLKDTGYRGYIVLEYEEGKPFEEIPMYLDQLREAIA